MSTTIPPALTGTPRVDTAAVQALYDELCSAARDADKTTSWEDHQWYAGRVDGLTGALEALGMSVDHGDGTRAPGPSDWTPS